MYIKMAGIDHERARLEDRELFAFTKQQAQEWARQVAGLPGVEGCTLLSTCNRTELWMSYTDDRMEQDPFFQLCLAKEADPEQYRHLAVERQGKEAVEHLFQLACGMKSRIYGEDQILAQVKNAASLSREAGCEGVVLATLFRDAVTAAKKVKNSLRLTGRDVSSASAAAELLETQLGDLTGRKAMVIGNGEMGRLAASILVQKGCDVWMTVRAYHRGEVVIPAGCRVVSYEERMNSISKMEMVISATTSPHYTVKYGELEKIEFPRPLWLVDLAVPRDIEPEVARLGHHVYTIDDLTGLDQRQRQETDRLAEEMIHQELEDFYDWYEFRRLLPAIDDICQESAQYILDRVGKELPPEQERRLEAVSQRAVGRLLYGLREHLPREQWRDCMTALYKAAMK